MGMPKTVKLRTGEELKLAMLTGREDPRELQMFINSFVAGRDYLLMDKKVTLKEEKEWLKSTSKAVKSGKQIYLRAIHDGKMVASCTAVKGRYKEKGNVLLGIAVKNAFRGKGLGRVMLSEVIKRAKKKWRPHNIYLSYMKGNKRAKMLYESMGFKEFAVFPKWYDHYGKKLDGVFLRLGD